MAGAAKVLLAVSLLLAQVHSLLAQQFPAGVPQNPPPLPKNPSEGSNLPGSRTGLTDFFTARTPYEFWLTFLIIIFGIITVLLFLLSVHKIENKRPEDVARPIIVVVLIAGALILVTAGYSNEQIAPAFGLLGTIAGYILGRTSRPEAERPTPSPAALDDTGTQPPTPGVS